MKKNIFLVLAALLLALCVVTVILVTSNTPDAGTDPDSSVDTTEASDTMGVPGESSEPQAETDATADGTGDGPDVSLTVGERGDYSSEGQAKPSDEKDQTQAQDKDQTENTGGDEQNAATQPTAPSDGVPSTLTFAQYEAMSEEEQEAFVESFESVSAFVEWWNAAKKEQEDRDTVEIEDGKIDLGNLAP